MKIGNLEVYGIIYKITNNINSKNYIGQTKNGFQKRYWYSGKSLIERVYKTHKYNKTANKSYNEELLFEIKKFGFTSFSVCEFFDIAFSKQELDIKEKLWIEYFDCIDNGYNLKDGGANGEYSYEIREKMSKIAKIRYSNTNHPRKGKPLSEETKNKISKALKGKITGENSYWYGKKHNIKDLQKQSETMKMKYRKGILRVWCEGKKFSDEHRKKLSIAKTGKYLRENSPSWGRGKKVICLNNLKVFKNSREACEYYNLKSRSNIHKCCRKERKSAGKDLITGEKLKWLYYEEYLKMNN